MTSSDADVVRRAFEAQIEGGVEAMLRYVHEEFEMETPPGLASEPDTYRGHDGVRRWFTSFYEAMDQVRVESDRIEPVSDRVALSLRIVTRGRSSGLEGVQVASALCTVVDGKVKELEFFATWDEAVASDDPS